jgi:hypothetical protein
LTPNWGLLNENTTVLVKGTGFEENYPDLKCWVHTDEYDWVVAAVRKSETEIECTMSPTPDAGSGVVNVYVLLNGQPSEVDLTNDLPHLSYGEFTYKMPAPTIVAIDFSTNLRALEVQWDASIRDQGTTDCSAYFNEESVSEHLNGATCKLTTSRLLTVSLGQDSHVVYGARFPIGIYTRGCHWFPRLMASSEQACDQWHSSRVSTPLTSSHCKLRPNTEGLATP